MLNLNLHTKTHIYHFTFRLGFLLLCVSFFCLMCALGVWQIHRYHFKKNLQEMYQVREASPPFALSILNLRDLPQQQFKKIVVSGIFVNDKNIFLQNQFHGNEVGYDVLTPLKISGEKKLLLVDRGWISNNGNPNAVPHVAPVSGEQNIMGVIKLQNEYQFILGKNVSRASTKPIVIQKIDMKDLVAVTGQEFFPFYVRMSAKSKNGFIREWVVTAVEPSRHMAYAIQWFLMAAILVIAYLATVVKREKINAN